MAFYPPIACDQEKQCGAYDCISQAVEKTEVSRCAPIFRSTNSFRQLLTQTPLVNCHKALSVNVVEPCPGYHQFRVWIPIPGQPADVQLTTTTYRLIQPSSASSLSQVCVPRCRAWPIAFAFRPSVTPLDWWLRITPVFADGERTGDVVEKCRKHQVKSPGSASLQDLSFIEVLGPFAQYTKNGPLSACPKDQISVCFRLDVIELLRNSRVEEDRDSERDLSQDQASQSILLPEVRKTILCLIHCYNSCLGIGLKGEIDLVVTLEALPSDGSFHSEHEILGLQKVRVRCCACPSRDAREVRELRHRPTDLAAISAERDPSRPARKTSRCLSLTIPARRNVQTRLSTSHRCMDSSTEDLPPAEVTIGARKYFVLLTDDPLDYSRLRESRNVRSHSSGRWSGRDTRPDIKKIDRAYTQRELLVAQRYAVGVAARSENNCFSCPGAHTLSKLGENGEQNESEASA